MDSLKRSDNTDAYLDSEKSELLNSYFSSIFTDEGLSCIPSFKLDFDINSLTDIEFIPCIMHNKLINLDPAEGWPIVSLKECAQQLSVPLSILFSKSFNSTFLPLAWKEALVTPIYKKGGNSIAVIIDLLA